ncbi:methylenetetrahydrofolate reductase [Leguminivora glycinivorella]|uniref:methylenetetrahydrofolate reductase n=1 Tax=Leguminivora glycinivorella TaxID=1035111 RepID=UPI00200E9143|nr:methylenetetrahydrofolate reductase [Leguminivora glycinivorella]
MTLRKITDLIKHSDKFSYSFEVTPDVTVEEINNLKVEPVFFSVTWHAKNHKCEDLDIAPLRMAKLLRSKQHNVLLHLTCDMLKKDYLDQVLILLQEQNICNLLVMLGEKYDAATSDFKSARDLVMYIKASTGNYFCIGVAGSPDQTGEKLLNLKEKIDNGADFILTQAFFEKEVFNNFAKSCKEIGIRTPIIPGVFLFQNLKQLNGFIDLCKVKVSQDLLDQVKVKEESNIDGLQIVKKLIQDLIAVNELKHFHFFTLNKLDIVSNFVKEI